MKTWKIKYGPYGLFLYLAKYVLLCVGLIFPLSAFTQESLKKPYGVKYKIPFDTFEFNSGINYGTQIINLKKAGFITLHKKVDVTSRYDTLNERDTIQLLLSRTNRCHKVTWSKELTLTPPEELVNYIDPELIAKLNKASSHFYLALSFPSKARITLMKFTHKGKMIWSKAYSYPRNYYLIKIKMADKPGGGLMLQYLVNEKNFWNPSSYTGILNIRANGKIAYQRHYPDFMYLTEVVRLGYHWYAGLRYQPREIIYFNHKGEIRERKGFYFKPGCVDFSLLAIGSPGDSAIIGHGYSPSWLRRNNNCLGYQVNVYFKLDQKGKLEWQNATDGGYIWGSCRGSNTYSGNVNFFQNDVGDPVLFMKCDFHPLHIYTLNPESGREIKRKAAFLPNSGDAFNTHQIAPSEDSVFLVAGDDFYNGSGEVQSVVKADFRDGEQCFEKNLQKKPENKSIPIQVNDKKPPSPVKKPLKISSRPVQWKPANVKAQVHCPCSPNHYQCQGLGPDTLICHNSTHLLKAGRDTSILNYQWNTGDTGNTTTIDSSSLYKVRISQDGCMTRDSIHVTFIQEYPAQFPPDTVLCQGDSVHLSAPDSNVQYRWLPAGVDSFANGRVIDSLDRWVQEPGGYALYLDTFPRCPIKTFRLKRYQRPVTSFEGDTVCRRDTVLLRADTLQHGGWFQSGMPTAATPELEATDTGRYLLKDTFYGCLIDTFRLSHVAYEPALGGGDTLCPYDSVRVVADTTQALTYGWSLPGKDTATHSQPGIWIRDTGHYTLWEVKEGCRLDTFTLGHYRLPESDAGPDTVLCYNQVYRMQGSGGVQYKWLPATYLSNDTIAKPKAQLPEEQSYLLIVSNEKGCRDTSHVTLEVRPPLRVALSSTDSVVCRGSRVQLQAEGMGGYKPGYSYRWPGSGKTGKVYEEKIKETGWQEVVLKDDCSAPSRDSVFIQVNPLPKAGFETVPGDTVFVDDTLRLINRSRSARSVEWQISGGEGTGGRDTLSRAFSDTGSYRVSLIAERANGCHDTARGRVYVEKAFRVFIPDAFSPNGDGLNEEWGIRGLGIQNYEVQIYNRWGEQIYESTGESDAVWDGTAMQSGEPVPAGVYLYKLTVRDKTGFRHYYKGKVQVVR